MQNDGGQQLEVPPADDHPGKLSNCVRNTKSIANTSPVLLHEQHFGERV